MPIIIVIAFAGANALLPFGPASIRRGGTLRRTFDRCRSLRDRDSLIR
jgi:hypothetical protein